MSDADLDAEIIQALADRHAHGGAKLSSVRPALLAADIDADASAVYDRLRALNGDRVERCPMAHTPRNRWRIPMEDR